MRMEYKCRKVATHNIEISWNAPLLAHNIYGEPQILSTVTLLSKVTPVDGNNFTLGHIELFLQYFLEVRKGHN